MMRQFGVVVGPLSIFLLKYIEFEVSILGYQLKVTEYSAAGLVLGIYFFKIFFKFFPAFPKILDKSLFFLDFWPCSRSVV